MEVRFSSFGGNSERNLIQIWQQAALAYKKEGNLEGKTIAIQGAGNVATPMIRFLIDKGEPYNWVALCHNLPSFTGFQG